MRMKMAPLFLAVMLMGIHTSVAAVKEAATAAPKGMPALNPSCQPLKLKSQNKNVTLDASDSPNGQIYLIKNHSASSIWLDHPVKKTALSAGWSSYLRPGEWSALLIDNKGFSLSCAVIQPGSADNLDCGQALTICKPSHLTYSAARKGSFWLVEGKSWKEMIAILEKKGVK